MKQKGLIVILWLLTLTFIAPVGMMVLVYLTLAR